MGKDIEARRRWV